MIKPLMKSTPYFGILLITVAWAYFTLSWRVNKARRAFEKQMIAQGMSKEKAQQLSLFYEDLRVDITTIVKQNISIGGFR
jgi:hypothetical protein